MSITTGTLLTYVENKTQAGTGTLNVATPGIDFLNEAMLDLRSELIKRGIDAAQIQESYASATTPVSGQGSTFAFPTDLFRLKTIEVNMTDTSQNNYLQAQPVEMSNTPGMTSYDFLRKNQSVTQPLFDNHGDTFEIYPSFASSMNLTNAMKIVYFLTPTLYTTTSDTLAYPDSLHWYILADKVSAIYYQSLSKFGEAESFDKEYIKKLNNLVEAIAPASQQPISAQGLPLTGFEY